MNSVKAITKNVVSLTLMNIVTIVAILILNIFITRSLGDENFGKYSFAIAFTAIFGIIIPLGMDKLIIRDIARDPEKTGKYLNNILFFQIFISIIIFFAIVCLSYLMQLSSDTIFVISIFGLYVIFTNFAGIYRAAFQALELMEYPSITDIIKKVIILFAGLSVLFSGYGIIAVSLAFLLGSIFDLAFSYFLFSKKITKLKFEFD